MATLKYFLSMANIVYKKLARAKHKIEILVTIKCRRKDLYLTLKEKTIKISLTQANTNLFILAGF